MRTFFTLLIPFVLLIISKATITKPGDIKDILKDFAKDPAEYIENLENKIKTQIMKEILKYSLDDYLNITESAAVNITHINFQNILPLFNFLSKINLTNHTRDELEKIIWQSIPPEYNTTDLKKLREDQISWADFSEKFIKNILSKFTTDKIEFIDHIYEKIKIFYHTSNSSHLNLTEQLKILGDISHDIISNKGALSDIAKNLHKKLRNNDNDQTSIKTSESSNNVTAFSQTGFFIWMSVFFVGILLTLVILIRRHYMKKRAASLYNEMEPSIST